jgi:YfiH family protein
MRSAIPEHSITPSIFTPYPALVAAVSTRRGGSGPMPFGMNLSLSVGDDESRVLKNRELFFRSIGVPIEALAIPQQVHGTTIRRVDLPGLYPECDGLISSSPGLFLCITVADCVPILLFDPLSGALGAIHAGWRGAAERIAEKAVTAMAGELGARPDDLLAYLGPAVGSCCYYVGRDVSSQFDKRFVEKRDRGEAVDLKGASAEQLRSAGVRPDHIEVSPHCTVDEPHIFHSYRRDGAKSGRMMAVIGKTLPKP